VSYGRIRALHGVSLAVDEGAVVALIGANGAGKSTLLRAISGILRPRRGAIRFAGEDLVGVPVHQIARRRLIHVPEGRGMLARMTVLENLRVAGFARRDRAGTSGQLERIFALFPVLNEMLGRRGGDLSGGQQQQLAIGRALVMRPRLLLLDEPTEGIQPSIIKEIGRAIAYLRNLGQIAVVLVEQYLDFARELGDHFVVMDRGSIVFSRTRATTDEAALKRAMAI